MEKALEIQKQIWDNGKTLNSYMTDLQNWEAEMKRKEAALSGELEQVLSYLTLFSPIYVVLSIFMLFIYKLYYNVLQK